jgi:hypothetical protein
MVLFLSSLKTHVRQFSRLVAHYDYLGRESNGGNNVPLAYNEAERWASGEGKYPTYLVTKGESSLSGRDEPERFPNKEVFSYLGGFPCDNSIRNQKRLS